MQLFYAPRTSPTIERAGSGYVDGAGTEDIVLRVQPRSIAPAGPSRESSLGNLWCVVRHDGPCRLTLTPVVDDEERSDIAATYDFDELEKVKNEVVKLKISEPATWPGESEPFSQQAVRGVWATVRAELLALAHARVTIDPAGDDNALEFRAVATGIDGEDITITYVDPGAPDIPQSVAVVGNAITVTLDTTSGGDIDSTAQRILEGIQASAAASALVTVALSDVDADVGDGSGIVTEIAETALADGLVPDGEIFALGGFALEAKPVGIAGPSIPVSS